MKLGIISLGGPSSVLVAEKAKKYFSQVDSINLRDIEVHLSDEGINVNHLKKDLEKYDCVYIRGSYKYSLLQRSITRALWGECFIPIKASAFTLGHDKFLTLIELQKNGVPIPKTYFAETTRLAKKILEFVDYPVILKLQEGTQGKGVLIAESIKSARTILDLLGAFKKPYVIQEFVKTNGTSDIRIVVAGEKILASYKRVACEGEIRANIHAGGVREEYTPSEKEKELAIASAKAIGAEICGVDIFHSDNPSVIEVNLSPGVSSLNEIGFDVPEEIAKYLYERTIKFFKKKKRQIKKKEKKLANKIKKI